MTQQQRCLGRIAPARHVLAALPRFGASAPMQQLPDPPGQIILPEAIATPTYAGTLGNTIAGDCTLAGVLRIQQRLSAQTRPVPLQFTDQQALADYSVMTGYNPATGQPDPGCVETDVLDYWARTGWQGNRIAGYTAINPRNITHIKQSIWVYGCSYLGVDLTQSAMDQTDAGEPWTVDFLSPSIGGHCVPAFEYDDYYLYCGTWAKRQAVSWDYVLRRFDAAYALVDPYWLQASGQSPGGLDLAGLTADLNYVSN
jgi:hypothetical protein